MATKNENIDFVKIKIICTRDLCVCVCLSSQFKLILDFYYVFFVLSRFPLLLLLFFSLYALPLCVCVCRLLSVRQCKHLHKSQFRLSKSLANRRLNGRISFSMVFFSQFFFFNFACFGSQKLWWGNRFSVDWWQTAINERGAVATDIFLHCENWWSLFVAWNGKIFIFPFVFLFIH